MAIDIRLATIAQWLLGLLIPIGLLIGAISILTSPAYISFEYEKPGFPTDAFGFTPTERLDHASDNIRFLREGYPASFLEEQNHEGIPLYNEREIKHMEDVQTVFQSTWQVGRSVLVIMLVLSGILLSKPAFRPHFTAAIEMGGAVSAVMVTLISVLALVGWSQWFTTFHLLFFQPGTWTFSMSDTLIRLFPMNFWFDSALTVSSIVFVAGLILAVTGWFLRKRTSPKLV